jgi:hypothetical protein
MNMPEEQLPEFHMDASALYREEVYTDRRVGTLRVLTPVTPEGETDPGRPVSYVGGAQLMTPVGALPLSFEIPAASLAEAIDNFSGAAQQAVEQAVKELQELRREAASSIVIPEPGGGGLGGAGGMGGPGSAGGGKIQFP